MMRAVDRQADSSRVADNKRADAGPRLSRASFASMVHGMNRRLTCFIIRALVLAQVMFALPVSAGLGGASSTRDTAGNLPCHANMAISGGHDRHCPCCPDGAGSMTDCLVQCAGAAASDASRPVQAVQQRAAALADQIAVVNDDPADPPLKPPPIL
jgi:hypothetical protein